MNAKNFLLSAVIAGVVAAVLSVVPVVNLVNCLLCGWIWISAIFAVWLYRRFNGLPLTLGQAALLGLVTGLICAVLSTALQAAFQTSVASAIPPETMSQLEQAVGPDAAQMLTAPSTSIFIGLVFSLIFEGLFGALGGLIGGAIFKPKTGPVV